LGRLRSISRPPEFNVSFFRKNVSLAIDCCNVKG
jgi:hypothetical protein